MARKYKQPSIVSGMSIDDIMNMDIQTFNKLNKADLRKVVGRLVSAGNKRLRAFEKAGESSPSTRHIERTGGAFSTKGKNVNELRAEYTRAKTFLQSKTSSRRGWKKVKKDTAETLKRQGVKGLTPDKLDDVLKVYERLKEVDPSVATKNMKYRIMSDISEMTDGRNIDDVMDEMLDRIDDIYEEQQGGANGGVSGFFEI